MTKLIIDENKKIVYAPSNITSDAIQMWNGLGYKVVVML